MNGAVAPKPGAKPSCCTTVPMRKAAPTISHALLTLDSSGAGAVTLDFPAAGSRSVPPSPAARPTQQERAETLRKNPPRRISPPPPQRCWCPGSGAGWRISDSSAFSRAAAARRTCHARRSAFPASLFPRSMARRRERSRDTQLRISSPQRCRRRSPHEPRLLRITGRGDPGADPVLHHA